METNFTKELKEKWLTALKSGKYTQGVNNLVQVDNGCVKHCCLGVLAVVAGIKMIGDDCIVDGEEVGYKPINMILRGDVIKDRSIKNSLIRTNDESCDGKYTTVIPLIEQLETID